VIFILTRLAETYKAIMEKAIFEIFGTQLSQIVQVSHD